MSDPSVSIDIPVRPWFHDHGFDNRIVLPAVEIMLLLAAEAKKRKPELDIRVMEQAVFSRFFELPRGESSCRALVQCRCAPDGTVRACLQSRARFRLTSRIFDHAQVVFRTGAPEAPDEVASMIGMSTEVEHEISTRTVYRDYVPFGQAYQTLQGQVRLSRDGACGIVKAPGFPLVPEVARAGSPFPLDGAMHIACVHGQEQVDFIPFPVAFARRIIYRPTAPGEKYHVRVEQAGGDAEELIYNLLIFDARARVFEQVEGLRMRDVGVAQMFQR